MCQLDSWLDLATITSAFHDLQRGTENQRGLGHALNIVCCKSWSDLFKHKAIRYDVDPCHLGDNRVHDAHSGQRQSARFQDLGLTFAGRVFHGHNHAPGSSDQSHGTAHAFDHLPVNHPIGEIAFFVYFHRAQDTKVDMTAADHRERISAGEVGGAFDLSNSFLSSIDQVGVFRTLNRVRSDS